MKGLICMYHVEYQFNLDVARKETRTLFSSLGQPYPILKNAHKLTVSCELPEMFTLEEQREFLENTRCALIGQDLGSVVVEGARFVGIAAAYLIVKENNEGGWVPCQDSPPEENVPVQVVYQNYNNPDELLSDALAYWNDGSWFWWDGADEKEFCRVKITHWKPLSAPPKKVK